MADNDYKPNTDQMSGFVQAAVDGLIKTIDERFIARNGEKMLDGLNLASLKTVAHSGNEQTAAANVPDVSQSQGLNGGIA